MEKIVTGCSDCPMYGEYMVGDDPNHACYHPENPATWDEPFTSCPLKTEPITIVLTKEG